jgi:hypothetical protein
MAIFVEKNVFLQRRWIGLFGSNRAYLHLGTPKFQEVFLSKHMLDNPSSKTHSFLTETQVFLQLRWISLLGATWDFLHLENDDCRNYSFQNKLSSHKEKMCLVLLPLTDKVLFQKILPFWKISSIAQFAANRAYFHLETPKQQKVFLSRNYTILTGKQCATCSCF